MAFKALTSEQCHEISVGLEALGYELWRNKKGEKDAIAEVGGKKIGVKAKPKGETMFHLFTWTKYQKLLRGTK